MRFVPNVNFVAITWLFSYYNVINKIVMVRNKNKNKQ